MSNALWNIGQLRNCLLYISAVSITHIYVKWSKLFILLEKVLKLNISELLQILVLTFINKSGMISHADNIVQEQNNVFT